MQLKLTRSQREGGVIASSVIFCLDARAELTAAERSNVHRYKLGNQVLYSSEASKRHAERAEQHMAQTKYRNYESVGLNAGRIAFGILGGMASTAMNRLALNITIDSLQRGHHIECKDLNEVLSTEDALHTACENLRGYLATAATFDGRETLIDFSGDEPQIVVPNPMAVASTPAITAAPPPPAALEPPPPPAYETTPMRAATYEDAAISSAPSGELVEKIKYWWAYRTSGQRIFIIGIALVVAYTFLKAL